MEFLNWVPLKKLIFYRKQIAFQASWTLPESVSRWSGWRLSTAVHTIGAKAPPFISTRTNQKRKLLKNDQLSSIKIDGENGKIIKCKKHDYNCLKSSRKIWQAYRTDNQSFDIPSRGERASQVFSPRLGPLQKDNFTLATLRKQKSKMKDFLLLCHQRSKKRSLCRRFG